MLFDVFFFFLGKGEVVVVDKVHREINFLYVLEKSLLCLHSTYILDFLSIYMLSDKCLLLV